MDRRVQQSLRLMESNGAYPTKRGNLESLAKSVNLSGSRLWHIFKVEIGLSPKAYADFLRLERAKKLLEAGSLSVKEVAFELGMNHESHFVRCFKKAFGTSPGYYKTHLVSTALGWPPPTGLQQEKSRNSKNDQ